jgi:hypothetical protein
MVRLLVVTYCLLNTTPEPTPCRSEDVADWAGSISEPCVNKKIWMRPLLVLV